MAALPTQPQDSLFTCRSNIDWHCAIVFQPKAKFQSRIHKRLSHTLLLHLIKSDSVVVLMESLPASAADTLTFDPPSPVFDISHFVFHYVPLKLCAKFTTDARQLSYVHTATGRATNHCYIRGIEYAVVVQNIINTQPRICICPWISLFDESIVRQGPP